MTIKNRQVLKARCVFGHNWIRSPCPALWSVVIVVSLVTTTAAGSARASSRPISVCAALRMAAALDGKEVAIRGRWMSGLEQVGIYAYHCSPRDASDSEGKLAAIRITSEGTNASLENARETLVRLRAGLKNSSFVVATFRGTLRRAGPAGSGHLGEFHVDLAVKEIRDITIARERSRQ